MKLKAGELGTTLFELAPCAVVVVDRDYNIISANPAFRESYGAWEGSHCYEVFKRQHRPCSRCAALETFRDGRVHVTEERGLNKEGQHTFFEVKTAPLFDDAGHVEYVLEMTVDISRFKDLERRYQLLFERVPCFISVLDRNYRIIDANWRQRETFGDKGELCHQLYMQAAEPCEECPVRRTFTDGRVHTQQKQVLDKNGKPIHFFVYSAPLQDPAGTVQTVIEMATDITPMVEMQDRLLDAEGDAAMDRAIAVLRTTLEQLLAGFAGLARLREATEQCGDGAGRQALDRLQLRIDHLTIMLAVMARSGQLAEVPPQMIAPDALVESVVRLLGEQASASLIRIRSELASGLGPLPGEASTLRDCLACLIYDFVEICPPRGQGQETLLLQARQGDEGGVLLEICRPGLGLVPGDALADDAGQGLSMSLVVVKRMVERWGGTVEFSSAQGRGVTFTISFPGFPDQ